MGEWKSSVQTELERGVRRRAGLVIGVVRDGETSVYGRSADGAHLDGRSMFEIGSITKTFTSLLLAVGVVRGEWTLDTPVRDLLPPGAAVPSSAGVEITLEHLATHTSGLPNSAIPIVAGTLTMLRGRDPYADLTADGLLRALATATLKGTPGTGSIHYSNLGVGVLGQHRADQPAQHGRVVNHQDLDHSRQIGPRLFGLRTTPTVPRRYVSG